MINKEINTYGTKGLPYFGPAAIDQGKTDAIVALAGAFNNLMVVAKKYHVSETALIEFGTYLTAGWALGEKAVAGKAVVNL